MKCSSAGPVNHPVRGLPLVLFPMVPRGNDPAEKAVTLIKNARGEEKDVRGTRNMAVTKAQAPEAVNRDRLAVAVFELAVERVVLPVSQLKAVDAPVAEVAHQ